MKGSAKWRWTPAFVWASFIFLTSCFFVPSKQFVKSVAAIGAKHISEQGFNEFWKSWWWLFVKGYHVLEFAALTLLVFRALRNSFSRNKSIVWAALFSLFYACSDEWHQTFVKDRGGKWTDVAIDSIGIAMVSITLALMTNWTTRNSRSEASI
ncbi:MAG TPA: VanZ family protein [Fimbriimonadaceae bacterium]|jgi:hypothetical protein